MLNKIISMKNIGRFKNYSASGNVTLSRCTLILGANGFGKTTICATLRSLKSGDPALIGGRHTLEAAGPPTANLLSSEGVATFDGSSWSNVYPHLEIFDSDFVSENVHSGEEVHIGHRRNLYRVIIGEKGVALAKYEAELAEKSRDMTKEITAATKAIQPHVPIDMSLDDFIGLPAEPNIDSQIIEKEHALKVARQAKEIVERPSLTVIDLPALPGEFFALLDRTIDDIGKDAETKISKHLEAHGMETNGGNWLARGLEFSDRGTCPFCGQTIDGLQLVAAYRAVFGDKYKAHRNQIKAMRNQIAGLFGEAAIARLSISMEQNRGGVEFWSQYCTFDPASLELLSGIVETMRTAGQAALGLIESKDLSPLEAIELNGSFEAAVEAYRQAESSVRKVVEATSGVNKLIGDKKNEAAVVDVRLAEAELAAKRATKARHANAVKELCTDYVRFAEEKKRIDQEKTKTRAQLNAHTSQMIKPYEARINYYLRAFNTRFRITETKHGYPGGTAASTYQLVIDDKAVELGNPETPREHPSFKNTLSSGDRMTLALAFFLAYLECDTEIGKKTVVFDDPFTSQDSFRRRQTVQEIIKLAKRCSQVIVLSHDATFLEQIWDKAPSDERTALSLNDHRNQGSKILPLDLKRACQGRTARDIDDLQTYLTTGEGNHDDLIRKMRVVLETYCWTLYPSAFKADKDWLGSIVGKICGTGEQHPAWHLCTELEEINDYTSEYHHGENMVSAKSKQIDPQELTGFVRRTLQVVNALQA